MLIQEMSHADQSKPVMLSLSKHGLKPYRNIAS